MSKLLQDVQIPHRKDSLMDTAHLNTNDHIEKTWKGTALECQPTF
jgi:hypothetical protein